MLLASSFSSFIGYIELIQYNILGVKSLLSIWFVSSTDLDIYNKKKYAFSAFTTFCSNSAYIPKSLYKTLTIL